MPTLGYCTNVHAGASFDEMRRNLDEHAVAVKRLVSPHAPLPIGLWLSAPAAAELAAEPARVEAFRDWLGERGLVPFTFNGFPYGDFHEPIVKHRVYYPGWDNPLRERYTVQLAEILAMLLPEGAEASISTVPLGWGGFDRRWPSVDTTHAEIYLKQTVEALHRIEEQTGRYIHLDLEPEPGCAIADARGVCAWFAQVMFVRSHEDRVRRYLGVCHDICHAAVVFDDQAEAFAAYDRLGIRIGKVQISSAIRCDLTGLNDLARAAAAGHMERFAEDRYLHQTFARTPRGVMEYADLPDALHDLMPDACPPEHRPIGEWRTHFHVPVYLDRLDDLIGTTQDHIAECIRLLKGRVEHWEVETYAWNVLPPELRTATLAEGIAAELRWAARQLGMA